MNVVARSGDLVKAREALDELAAEIEPWSDSIDRGAREVSLAITKMQESRMWIGEALKQMGHFKPEESE